ncbi:MAG: xanthine phosphoribosyltransferase [Chloroflexota bacterium]
MQLLIDRIRAEGRNLGGGILNVNSLINHQVDPTLMMAIGKALATRFGDLGVNRVITAETSGIAPALMTALALGVSVVFARKSKPVTLPENVYTSTAVSRTKGGEITLMISPDFLRDGDNVLIVDDFLASGSQTLAMVQLVQKAQANVIGVGAVIEKEFEGGRAVLEAMDIRVESLARLVRMTDDALFFAGEA